MNYTVFEKDYLGVLQFFDFTASNDINAINFVESDMYDIHDWVEKYLVRIEIINGKKSSTIIKRWCKDEK